MHPSPIVFICVSIFSERHILITIDFQTSAVGICAQCFPMTSLLSKLVARAYQTIRKLSYMPVECCPRPFGLGGYFTMRVIITCGSSTEGCQHGKRLEGKSSRQPVNMNRQFFKVNSDQACSPAKKKSWLQWRMAMLRLLMYCPLKVMKRHTF